MFRIAQISMFVAAIAMLTTPVFADPPNEYVPKFIQKPMVDLELGGTVAQDIYYGHDEESTAYLKYTPGSVPYYEGTFMADDFADTVNQSILHVQWWGSYMQPTSSADQQVKRFLIAFEKDVPATDTHFSFPGEVLSSQIVTLDSAGGIPAPGSFTERSIHPGGPQDNEELFLYNAELEIPFEQKENTVYWLKIVALVDQDDPNQDDIKWGWHNRNYTIMDPFASVPPAVNPGEHIQGSFADSAGNKIDVWHFQDDAVTGYVNISVEDELKVIQDVSQETYYQAGYDLPEYVSERFSKDLAFALYAIPEPSTVALLGIGCGVLLSITRRRVVR